MVSEYEIRNNYNPFIPLITTRIISVLVGRSSQSFPSCISQTHSSAVGVRSFFLCRSFWCSDTQGGVVGQWVPLPRAARVLPLLPFSSGAPGTTQSAARLCPTSTQFPVPLPALFLVCGKRHQGVSWFSFDWFSCGFSWQKGDQAPALR